MSIFKETLEESIQTQLQARTLVVSGINNNRNQLLPWYLSKNSWVRMTSFVNFTSGKELTTDEKGNFIVNPDGAYDNDQLSKKYILEGGTLYTRSNGNELQDAILRYGIGSPQSVYGGNIDVRANGTADPEYFRTFGIRPMPGIIDVNLRTLGAYGSLFETTVKFYAWDINQLNELEILFMRPGYSVLLEWGWSQYIDYSDEQQNLKDKLEANNIYPTVFNGTTLNPFENLNQDDVYKKLEVLRKKYRHNYDGMLGYVKNFNWTMMSNGGFECTTTLISMGDTINTVKMSSNVSVKNPSNNFTADSTGASNYVYDEYENILLSIKAKVEELKNYSRLDKQEVLTLEENEYKGSWDYNQNNIDLSKIKETIVKLYPDQSLKLDQIPYIQEIKSPELSNEGKYFEYLPLDTWLAIVNSYFSVKTNSTKNSKEDVPLVKFELPGENDLCLACKDSISVDPKICQIKNIGAFKEEMSFIEFKGTYKPEIQGINPPIYNFNSNKDKFILTDVSFKFYDETLKAGKIKNILVNINLLLSVYKDMKNNSNDEGVILLDYVKNVLNKISNSLGGLNNFNLSTVSKNHNTTKVVDLYYLESGTNNNYTSKYQFDLLGLGSICREISLQSQIFENQSTIVAIAAQSRANLANVYNSSQVYLNAGLKDRLALNKWQGEELDEPQGNVDDVFYQKLYNFMLYARDYLIGNAINNDINNNQYQINVDTSGQANPSSILRQSMLRYNNELNFKALIPFKLRLTLDGIGGIVVGQIFTLKQNILPKNYYDKKLGFVITQINHKLSKNDWETELETQICILDQEITPSLKNFINTDRSGFKKFIRQAAVKGILYPILVDFIEYQASRSLIGFLAAAQKDKVLGDDEGANEIIFDHVLNVEELVKTDGVVKMYWKDNISNFLFSDTSTNVNPIGFRLDQFKEFVQMWAKSYLDLYAEPNYVFINTETEQQVFQWMSNEFWLTNSVDQNYKDFQLAVQQIQVDLNQLEEMFYVDPSNINNITSLYTNNKGQFDFAGVLKAYIKYDTNSILDLDRIDVYGFNRPELFKRIDRISQGIGFSGIESFKNIRTSYFSGLKLAGGNTLRERYSYQSKKITRSAGKNNLIVYGSNKSVANNITVSEVNGPWSINNGRKVESVLNENSEVYQFPGNDSLNSLQYFVNTINWNGQPINRSKGIREPIRLRDSSLNPATVPLGYLFVKEEKNL